MTCKENDMTADRDENDDCHGSSDAMDLPVGEKNVIAFPHEHHWALQQEWLAVFGGASQVTLIDFTPGSGAKLLGVLLSNGRGIGVARSQAHVKWITDNLVNWVKQKRLVTINQLPKPDALVQWEKSNRPTPSPKPAVVPPTPKASPQPTPSPAGAASGSSPGPAPAGNAGSAAVNLLEAFGRVQT